MAKAQPNRSTVPLGTRIAKDVDAALRTFCDQRGENIRDVLELAIRRHIASPPPKLEVPPLPPLTINGTRKK